jgi:hypothetical protein
MSRARRCIAGKTFSERINDTTDVLPIVYPTDLKHDCEFLYRLNPLPHWNKSWRDFEKDGDCNDALYPIGNGIKQAIEKARLR